LPSHHRFRNNRNDLSSNKIERDVALLVLLHEELYDGVLIYEGIVFDFHYGKQKFHGFGVTHNWVK
jgi:hypothetical protein